MPNTIKTVTPNDGAFNTHRAQGHEYRTGHKLNNVYWFIENNDGNAPVYINANLCCGETVPEVI